MTTPSELVENMTREVELNLPVRQTAADMPNRTAGRAFVSDMCARILADAPLPAAYVRWIAHELRRYGVNSPDVPQRIAELFAEYDAYVEEIMAPEPELYAELKLMHQNHVHII